MSGVVALTGATGFIGQRLCHQLLAYGWRVRALARDPQQAQQRLHADVELVRGSLHDAGSLRQLVDGVDAVVHCAGAVRGITLQDFAAVNVTGLDHLLQAVIGSVATETTPLPRFLSLSSLAAREPQLSHYAHSKYRGEQLLLRQDQRLEWVALRPPAVYGPGDKELLPLFRWMQRGVAPIVGDRGGRFSMLYVDDLAAAMVDWLERGHGVSGVFELHDGRAGGYSWGELLQLAAEFRGGPVRALPVPKAVLQLVAAISVTAAKLAGVAPMLSPGKVRELRHHDWVVDDSAWQAAVAWRPQVQFGEGLRRTLIQ